MQKNRKYNNRAYNMTNAEYIKFHEEKFAELHTGIIIKADIVISEALEEKDKELIKNLILSNPILWASPHHFGWGMEVRNLLRSKVCLDDHLPSKNWDDYYVCCIEHALKMRKSRFENEEILKNKLKYVSIKYENAFKPLWDLESKKIFILPVLDLFWDSPLENFSITIGWIAWSLEIWFTKYPFEGNDVY